MTRYIKLIFVLLCILAQPVFAQENLFDCDNSRKFAAYLYNTQQYELAQHELERIRFFCKPDSTTQLILLKSYRKMNRFDKANTFFAQKTISELNRLSPDYKNEYIRLLMSQQLYGQVQQTFEQGFDIKEKNEMLLGTELLLENWTNAYLMGKKLIDDHNNKLERLMNIAERSYFSKRKKPWIATIMSVIFPGSGKVYSGYLGDGIISFLFTASTSYFAYRAFDKYGTQKVYPWMVSGLAISYYGANIYGGNRAAVRYNDNLNHSFIHETQQLLYSDN